MRSRVRKAGAPVNLPKLLAKTISEGLSRRAIQECSQWAEKYRMMTSLHTGQPEPWQWKYHPWLKRMHNSLAPLVVGQKSAQAGFTEALLNVVFYTIDIAGGDVLYVLPTKNPDATNFTAARFNPALEMSAHLQQIFSAVDNVGHKRAGAANLYIRGSRARAALKSIPANLIVFDEVEEMCQKNIPLAFERTSGKMKQNIWMVSTPSIEGKGINTYFKRTDQRHFFFRCPYCSRMTELVYPQCLVITGDDPEDPRIHESHTICKECTHILPHEDKPNFLADNEWVPQYENKDGEGFHINQLYSSTVTPGAFAKAALRARSDPAAEQELYNSKLGMTHTVAGSSVNDNDLTACLTKTPFSLFDIVIAGPTKPRSMGIDVGSVLHTVIVEWDIPNRFRQPNDPGPECTGRVIYTGKLNHFNEVSELFDLYGCKQGVIDANPERRKSYELCMKHWGKFHMCYYVRGVQGKQLNAKIEKNDQVVADEPSVCVDRTSWLDTTFARFKNRTIALPREIGQEYKDQIKAPVRVYSRGDDGELHCKYTSADDAADHFAHAQNYAEIALPFILGMGTTSRSKKKMF